MIEFFSSLIGVGGAIAIYYYFHWKLNKELVSFRKSIISDEGLKNSQEEIALLEKEAKRLKNYWDSTEKNMKNVNSSVNGISNRLDNVIDDTLRIMENRNEKYLLKIANDNIVIVEKFINEMQQMDKNNKSIQLLLTTVAKQTAPKKRGRPIGWRKS